MNIKAEKIEANVVKLEVTIPAEDFLAAMQKSYHKNLSKFNVPGFRKGKVPMAIVEKMYGPEVLFEDAAYIIYDDTYPKAIDEQNINPVDYPKLDIVQIEKGKDFIYTAEVTVKPEVKLGEYKGLEVEKVEYPVTDEAVDQQINAMRERNARIIEKTGAVESGDIAVIDFEGFTDGVAFEGGKGTDYELTIGSNTFIPGFEDQLIGKTAGEDAEVNVTFPEDYQSEELKGKPAMFKVTVKAVKAKELPELDDEFAKDVSEFDTLEELKQDERKKLETANTEKAKKEYEDKVVEKAIEACEIDIPQAMIDREADYMLRDIDSRLQYQGLNVEKYAQILGTTVDDMKKQFNEPAAKNVRRSLVLEAIAKAEGVDATDDEIAVKAEEIAKQYKPEDAEKIKNQIITSQKDIIRDELVNNKVIELLVSSSK
jgi:trigger factor